MKLQKLGMVLIGTVAASVLLGSAASAETLKVQSSFDSGQFSFKYLTDTWLPKLKEMTKGDVEIDLLPTKAVVPHRDTPDAVAAGVLDGDFTSTAYFSGRDPAFALMGDLIAGYDKPSQFLGFCHDGGGEQMLQKLFDKILPNKIHVVGCGPYSREALVAAKPIHGVADLKGIKIRAPEGMVAAVFKRAGATPVSMPLSDVYTAIDKGIVDAADASAYVNNDAIGLNKIAHYPLYPGIHSMPSLQFTINKAKWDKLSPADQKALRDWWYDAMYAMAKVAHQKDEELVARDKAGGKIHVIDWPQAERDKFREIAKDAWASFAKKSPLAKEVLDAHLAYMKKIGLLK